MALEETPNKLESVWIQRNTGNQYYEQINVSGSDLIIYHSSSGELQADKIPVFASKYGLGGGAGGTTVKVSALDTTAGYLGGKLSAGTNISFSVNSPGGNESITIHSTAGSGSSEFATSASYASSSTHADWAGFASSSLSASYASSSTHADWANFASSSLSASWSSSSLSSSFVRGGGFISGSLLGTASFAVSASWAPGGSGTGLETGSTYPITASWAVSASWAPPSSVNLLAYLSSSWTGSTTSFFFGTASHALTSETASYLQITASVTFVTSASWASQSLSASWAPSQDLSVIKLDRI
jgi:hypothetical protein